MTLPLYPPLTGDVGVDVAVVGGGIAGLTTALLLKQSGASVAVLDAHRIAAGTTGYTTAKVTSLHGLTYAELVEKVGQDKARLYGEANQAAVEQVAAFVDTLGIDCHFERQAAYSYTLDDARRDSIRSEAETATALGLPATYVEETELPYAVTAAVRFDNQAQFHPRRYCLALADAVAGDGSHVFERSRALGIDEEDDGVVVRTDPGSVSADQVVVATLLPFVDRGGFSPRRSPPARTRWRSASPGRCPRACT